MEMIPAIKAAPKAGIVELTWCLDTQVTNLETVNASLREITLSRCKGLGVEFKNDLMGKLSTR